MQLKSKNRKRYALLAHIVLTVKYRKSLLDKYGDFIKESFEKISNFYDFEISEMEVDKNHIHILINYNSKQSISKIVERLKQISTYNLWISFEASLRKIFWKKKVFWSSGYFVLSVGDDYNKVSKYIINQGRSPKANK